MEIQYLPVGWTTYHDLARKLAATIRSHAIETDQIVAIARGGLTFGHILSDFLRIPVATFTIQSFTDIQNQGEIKITEPLKSPIKGKSILLVDDVADSGTTLKRALSYLNGFKPKKITTVTMFFKPRSVYRPDFFAKQIANTKWIIFPYETTETIVSITKSMEKNKKSKAEIQAKLVSLGYTLDQIKFVRKYHLS
jgi:hypothetical protein